MVTKPSYKPEGLEIAERDVDRAVGRARDRTGHDPLHLLPSGNCGCMCSRCWRWMIVGRRGTCICMDCRCGGMPAWLPAWFPAVSS
jgi:hypothetical protein